MRYQIETTDAGSFVTPLDGVQAGKQWELTFNSPDAAREAILTVSQIGKIPATVHPLIAYGQAVQEQQLIPDYAID